MTDNGEPADNPERLAHTARAWWVLMHGTPSEDDREQFARWRTGDPGHEAAYLRQQHLWDQARLLSQTTLGAGRTLSRASLYDRRPVLAWAASATAAAVLTVGVYLGLPARLFVQAAAEQQVATLASPAEHVRTLRFGDGSLVTLDRASVLRVAFRPAERRMWLVAGRARFAVFHDAQRPFIVTAGDAVIIARGTLFDVDLGRARPRVVLLQGSVEVRRMSPSTSVLLAAGQEIVVDRTNPMRTPHPASAIETQWPSGMIELNATPLAEAVAEFNRHNVTQIILADPRVGTLRMSGAFHADDAEEFAAAAAVVFDLEVRRAASTLTLAARAPSSTRK